jgi:hypothetical protein
MDDKEKRNKAVRLRALSDQAWADLIPLYPDIARLAETGQPETERDSNIIMKALLVVQADMLMRAGDAVDPNA